MVLAYVTCACILPVCLPSLGWVLFGGVQSRTMESIYFPFYPQIGVPEMPKPGTQTWIRLQQMQAKRWEGNFLCWVKEGDCRSKKAQWGTGAGKDSPQSRHCLHRSRAL